MPHVPLCSDYYREHRGNQIGDVKLMAGYGNALLVPHTYVLYCKKKNFDDMDEDDCLKTTQEPNPAQILCTLVTAACKILVPLLLRPLQC